ncbi:protein kinase domain-containing protein [Streptomyces sp. NPDC002285]
MDMDTSGASRRLIDGRFELLGRLGSGGMGTVWRARDIMLHREVALKEVRPADAGLQEADPARTWMLSERVLREARALARLTHPHVVGIYHIVEAVEGFYPWIVMELVRGQSLYERIVQGPLSHPEAVRIGRGVLAALRAAHAEGIQHRDVKPANVLLRTDGSPVLTDFGIAALRESAGLTATGDLIGSPEYIAPERIRGEEGNPASDLWSLGMLLYVSLESNHPLRRDTTMATLVAVLNDPIPPPMRSGALAPLLNALLVRDVALRPDAAQLERMFDDADRGAVSGWMSAPPTVPSYGPGVGRAPTANDGTPVPSGTLVPGGAPASHGTPMPVAPFGAFGPPPSSPQYNGYGSRPPAVTIGEGRPSRPRSLKKTVIGASSAAITAMVLIVLSFLPQNGGKGNDMASGPPPSGSGTTSHPSPPQASASGPRETSQATLPPSKETKDLLTPAGVRSAIKAIETKTKTTKFFEFTVYGEYAFANVPIAGSQTKYDRYEFRNGYAKRSGPGGTATGDDDGPFDVSKVNWDVLPALAKKADKELNVSKPTMRYVIVRGPILESVPTVNLYLVDAYNSVGYLSADFDGAVLSTYPAES